MTDKMRSEFEKWYMTNTFAHVDHLSVFYNDLNCYSTPIANQCWKAWQAAQSAAVAVVGEPVAWVAYTSEGGFRGITLDVKEADRLAALGFSVNPLVHISKDYVPAAELATLREQAETHAIELRAYEATVQNLEQRIRQLEQELGEALMEQAVAVTGEPIAILRREIGEDTWFDWKPVLPNSKTHQQLKAAGEMDYCEVYKRYTQSIPASKLAALREKAATHALELRAYEATVENLEQRIRQLEQERVPEGWRIAERNTGSIIVYKEKIGSCVVSECPETERTIPEAILWALAKDILAAAPQPKKEGE